VWLAVALVLLPIAVYWPTVGEEFGFRDDYAHLREVRERPGWLFELTTANGRPVFGLVLESSVRTIEQVDELWVLRFTGVVLIGATGVLLWWWLRRRGWSESEAAAYGALVTLLPGAQVVAGWAIAWPIALGLLAATLGFVLVDGALEKQPGARALLVALGIGFYAVAALTYQTSAMFVMAPLAAVLLARPTRPLSVDARYVATHFAVLLVGLAIAVVAMQLVFSAGLVREATRMQLEPEPLPKLWWFLRQPLPNGLAMFALRDRFAEPLSFWVAFAAMLALILAGFVVGAKSRNERVRWLVCALGLSVAAHSVSLVASSQAIGYRTLLPISGVFLALALMAWRALMRRFAVAPRAVAASYGLWIVAAAVLAGYHAFALLATPQAREWQIVKAAAARLDLKAETTIYIVRPAIDDRSTERVYTDEFGSLSADADWAAKEMFKAAMRQRFPNGLPAGTSYTLTSSFYSPAEPHDYDLVVDMRVLRSLGDRLGARPASGYFATLTTSGSM
jgi:hypothetical protein